MWGLFLGVALTARGALAQNAGASEIVTHESEPGFKVQVQRNVVLVRVVVRDAKGHPVPDLRKEDFRVFDNGKAQTITQFALETPSSKLLTNLGSAKPEADLEAEAETTLAPSTPQRYMGLYFDDIHIPFDEIVRVRDAADRYLESAVQPGDRVGIFTSSGQHVLDFTDDRAKLHQALLQLRERPVVGREAEPCPDLSDYQAYLIVHQRDPYSIQNTALEILHCRYDGDTRMTDRARGDVESAALQVLSYSETEADYSLRGIENLVRRMTSLPGQRSVVLVSPGFLTETKRHQVTEIVDRALRANVVISGLDSRGLYASLPGGDLSHRLIITPESLDTMGRKRLTEINRLSIITDAMRMFATDTGGTFFNNSNDLEQGFRKAGSLPEVYYMLAFSPQNLKYDGRFHNLKVSLAKPSGMAVQARRGYFAPQKPLEASAQAKEEIQQALFSQDELNELPIDVHTQFFKVNDANARLSVLIRLDLRLLRFRKEGGRNNDDLTFVTGLFDRDGKFVAGREKLLELRLYDVSLERLIQSGLTLKTSFEVAPGTYLVRQVVRDAEGGQISGLNRTVEIPY